MVSINGAAKNRPSLPLPMNWYYIEGANASQVAVGSNAGLHATSVCRFGGEIECGDVHATALDPAVGTLARSDSSPQKVRSVWLSDRQ